MSRLNDSHETSIRRLGDTHQEKIALLDRQFLQQKQQLMRAREAAIWEMEERQLHERHQLAKRQLKDMFFLQRHQMLVREESDIYIYMYIYFLNRLFLTHFASYGLEITLLFLTHFTLPHPFYFSSPIFTLPHPFLKIFKKIQQYL